jgi:hypothetical protein
MFTKSKISQSMIDAVNSVMNEEDKKLLLEPGKKPVKIPTPTGTKVLGRSYGNSAKAHQDQTKHSVDDVKEPKKKDLEKEAHLYKKTPPSTAKSYDQFGAHMAKEEADCVTEPEAKDIAKKEVKGHEKKMHKEEMTFAEKLIEKAKMKMKENKGNGPQETFTDNNMGEEISKSDVPAYLRKQKGEKPLTVADVKSPKKSTISHPENLAKARNEGVELSEHTEKFAKSHGFSWHRETYGATMSHAKHGHININRYGEWTHHEKKGVGGRGVGIAMAHGDDQESLHHHLSKLHEGYVTESEVVTSPGSKDEVTTDMIRGRVKGGKSNSFKGYKLQLRTDGEMKAPKPEEGEKDTPAMKTRKTHDPVVNLPNIKVEEATEVELDEMINEVLSKDASAGDWIHDFVHSDNPKFAGKSKAERKKMALGAYYGKKNEEADEGTWHKETPWKKTKDVVTDKSGAKHTPMSRAKDLARSAFKKLKNETLMGKISN